MYVLGKRSLGDRFSRVLKGVAELMGVERELLVVNTMIYVNWVMMLGLRIAPDRAADVRSPGGMLRNPQGFLIWWDW